MAVSDEQMKLDLTAQRAPLAELFRKNPQRLYLALEIKALDDKIAECDRSIRQAGKARFALKK
jgi:hypothetical protein